MNNINSMNSQCVFTGRPVLPQKIKKVKQVFFSEFKDIKKPAELVMLSPEEKLFRAEEIKEANMWLKVIRELQRTAFEEGGNFEVFRRLISMCKTFKVGNCAEHAEIGKTICKMNKINDCDIFTLHAQAPDGTVRNLDHTVLAFKVPKSKNNIKTKNNKILFEPSKDSTILDLFSRGFSGNVTQARNVFAHFGLKPDEKLLFRPEITYEPNITTVENLRATFPNLVIKK